MAEIIFIKALFEVFTPLRGLQMQVIVNLVQQEEVICNYLGIEVSSVKM
jgi:hypothetical protein